MPSRKPELSCPYCTTPATVAAIHCPHCDVEVRAKFPLNEFAALAEDDLHFLRIFLECEGRIRDMEAPLGLSYPTIRSRLAELKDRVLRPTPGAKPPKAKPETPSTVLDRLADGELDFETALQQIKKRKQEKK